MAKKITEEQIKMLLDRGVEGVVVKEDLIEKLKSGKTLRIKHGVDPTTSDLHLGYAVIYEKLRQFQELGHTIIFLIGDFTARFGDPTDQKKIRTMRDKDEVKKMAKNYIKQVGKVLDLDKTEVRYNGEWYDKMSAEELLHLMSSFTHARMVERDMFAKRIANNDEVGLHELVYPILQGYDSVMLKDDLTVCGTDQLFNELQGRKLQEIFGQKPQDIVSMPLLLGTDGKQKMSQSLGNYIGLDESPADMFGKIMSIPDQLMPQYFELLTRIPRGGVAEFIKAIEAGKDLRDIKFKLAYEIVKNYHNEEDAMSAGKRFDKVFRDKEAPDDMEELEISEKMIKIIDLAVRAGKLQSNGEARRLIEQGGVKIDGAKITDIEAEIGVNSGMVVQVGKHRFVRVK